MSVFFAFLAGAVFGLGLLLSGMTEPSKVLGFLDLAGRWDPSLALVMAGAVAAAAPAFAYAARRGRTLTGRTLTLPASRRIDRRLVLGSLTFGAGWGLAGYCPGPALASLGLGAGAPWLFAAAMAAGMLIFELLDRRAAQRQAAPAC